MHFFSVKVRNEILYIYIFIKDSSYKIYANLKLPQVSSS